MVEEVPIAEDQL